LIEAKIHL